MKTIINAVIICCVTCAVGCGSHSLMFLSTGRVATQAGPVFEQLTVFDGVSVSYCDSETRKEQYKPILQTTQFFENCETAYVDMIESIQNIQQFTNTTVDVVQRRRGCTQPAGGSVFGSEVWAVNGKEFLTFNPETLKWTSKSSSGVRVELLWNSERTKNHFFSAFIRNHCPKIIEQITIKSVPKNTELRVFAKDTEYTDEAELRCHVTTTDRSVKSVYLIGDGASRVSWISVMGPLPSGDGSLILQLKAGFSLRHSSLTYGCAVQTEEQTISVYWDGKTIEGRYIVHNIWSNVGPVVIAAISMTGCIVGISCLMICLQKCVQMKRRPAPPPPRPELREQFESFIQSASLYPDIRNILMSFIYGSNTPDQYKDLYNQWLQMVEGQNDYDPEFYGGVSSV